MSLRSVVLRRNDKLKWLLPKHQGGDPQRRLIATTRAASLSDTCRPCPRPLHPRVHRQPELGVAPRIFSPSETPALNLPPGSEAVLTSSPWRVNGDPRTGCPTRVGGSWQGGVEQEDARMLPHPPWGPCLDSRHIDHWSRAKLRHRMPLLRRLVLLLPPLPLLRFPIRAARASRCCGFPSTAAVVVVVSGLLLCLVRLLQPRMASSQVQRPPPQAKQP